MLDGKLSVLRHHAQNIKKQLPGNYDEKKAKKIFNQQATQQSRLFTEKGEPVYPGLQTAQGRRAFVQEKMIQAEAVKTGNYIQIDDITTDGTHQFDNVCNTCGNRRNGRCMRPTGRIMKSR